MSDAWLEDLSHEECLRLLRTSLVGRVAVVLDDFPVVLPVNYRLVEEGRLRWIALRTRPGNVVDQAPMRASFEIDEIDPSHRQGWSVLVRGTLHRVEPDEALQSQLDPDTWLEFERDSWLIIEPFAISGRRLHRGDVGWAFSDDAYL
jgi:hypothetical protein